MVSLKLVDVWFKYPSSTDYVLKDINLEFKSGETYLVTGANGAGKSTLLLVSSGLLEPCRGDVYFNGEPIRDQVPHVRKYIGILFQNPETMLFNPIVYDEIAFALRQLYSDEEFIRKRVVETISSIGLSENILEKPIHSLSYGFKKLVAIASILSYKPKVLLLDEPHTNLSREYIEKLLSIVNSYRSNGCIVVIASHETDLYRKHTDHVIVLENGTIVSKY